MHRFSRLLHRLKPADISAILFFAVLLILGFLIYQDYGVSWDEPFQMALGLKTYHFIKNGDPALLSAQNRWHGPIFQLFLIIAQDHSSDQAIYFSRHLLTFLTFFLGALCFYFLARRVSQHSWLALLAVAALTVSPRIFADSFYNAKDIPFLVLYIFNLLSLLWYLDHPNGVRTLVHAILTAVLISIRIPGLFIPMLTFFAIIYELYNHRLKPKQVLLSFFIYLLLSAIFCVAMWPSLWPQPLNGFLEALASMSHFAYNADMLFMGQTISPSSIPWYYIPVWIGITTPILYLLAFIPGLAGTIYHQRKLLQRNISIDKRNEILMLLAFLGPLFAVILLRSSLYDGWRQMFFVYPPFLLVSIKGMKWVWEYLQKKMSITKALFAGGILLLIGLAPVAFRMIKDHPYQNVYFNLIAGKDMQSIQQNYMVDYWGLSYREGLEFLVSYDAADQINVYAETGPGEYNIPLLPLEDAVRVHIVRSLSEADYYIGNYYMQREPYPLSNEIFTVQVGNTKILSIFKLTEDEKY